MTTEDMQSVLIRISTPFKDAIGAFATRNDMDMVKVIRLAIADYIGYTLTEDDLPTNGRKKLYATNEERLEARRELRRTEKALLEMYKHSEHVRSIVAIQQSLAAKGINTDD